jgi:glycosyltransferase involved in cell wall biosynthesis
MSSADFIFLTAIFSGIIYLYFVNWLWEGINGARQLSIMEKVEPTALISVIIAAHNEENSIALTLESLVDQHYPQESFEIVLVADRCSDATVDIAKSYRDHLPMLKIVEIDQVPKDYSPKKFAIQTAIETVRYNNLILLDADCQLNPGALGCFNDFFSAGLEVVISIPKFLEFPTLLYNYYLPERILTWSIAAAAVGKGKPFLAFGPVWGYSQKAYEKAGGMSRISHVLSGDDDLLVSQMGKLSLPIAFCFNPEGWGKTRSPHSVIDFIAQRRRHHSAGKYYAFRVKLGYLLFHMSNLLLWILPLFEPILFCLLAAKFLLDFLVLTRISRIFHERLNIIQGLFFEMGYLLHHIFIAPLAFIGKVRWR